MYAHNLTVAKVGRVGFCHDHGWCVLAILVPYLLLRNCEVKRHE